MIIRDIIFSTDIDKYIEFIPIFQISTCPENFPKREEMFAHHPYFLDYEVANIESKKGLTSYCISNKSKYEDFKESKIPDFISQQHHNIETKNEILYLINALTDSYFFYYGFNEYSSRRSWTISLSKIGELHYSQEGYLPPVYENKLDKLTPKQNYEHFDPPMLRLTQKDNLTFKIIRLNDLLKLYYSFNKNKLKEEYLNACIVFSKSLKLENYDLSASYVFMVSAIESLISIEFRNEETKNCSSCSQQMYKVSKKFKDFIDKYGYKIGNEVKNDFYSLRSNMVHSGKLFSISYQRKLFIENQKDIETTINNANELNRYKLFKDLTKACFRTFLFDNFKS
ncbi:MAG: hypothetical protein OEV44_14505 [Spirochaetota bacterium]|nr:hypothetical protein [Spirochaetota bacterium]